jgi:hypothetical protein
MTTLELRANWNDIRKKLRQKFPDLTDADLRYVEGREAELVAHLQRVLCMTEEEIRREMEPHS